MSFDPVRDYFEQLDNVFVLGALQISDLDMQRVLKVHAGQVVYLRRPGRAEHHTKIICCGKK